MSKSLPTEFAINMCLEKMMILQQTELSDVKKSNYFDENDPCHIYFICKRPRFTVDPNQFKVTEKSISMNFKYQIEDKFIDLPIKLDNIVKDKNIVLDTKYPFNTFSFIHNNKILVSARVPVFLQTLEEFYHPNLDLEILYVGQSYGVEGARTAPDRLKSHSTLQGIYSEAIGNNPDSEIWLALASFNQINMIIINGHKKFSEKEWEEDNERSKEVFLKLQLEGINEQQKINFTEAALIKYFEPPYNKIYKDSFPNPAHSTYSECYDLDINSVCIELNTFKSVNCLMYSQKIQKKRNHMHQFLLRSAEERKSMFDF